MKHVLFAAALLLALGAQAQSTASQPVAQPIPYQYYLLYRGSGSWQLDYGQDASPTVVDAGLRADNAAVAKLKLKSEVAALNYLDGQGWESVNSTSYSGSTYSGRTTYLLRRLP